MARAIKAKAKTKTKTKTKTQPAARGIATSKAKTTAKGKRKAKAKTKATAKITSKALSTRTATRTPKPVARSYWPCNFVEHDHYSSIILGENMHLLGDRLGDRDAGGYAVDRLVKKLARENDPTLLRRVKFDSEASMFCAYSADRDALHAIATLLARATGTTEATTAKRARRRLTEAEDREARASLGAGFVLGLDSVAQKRFYELVAVPPMNPLMRGWLDALGDSDPKTRFAAARKINRYACNSNWSWDSVIGDPRAIAEVCARLDHERDDKVTTELLRVANRIGGRHLADLRLRSSLEGFLSSPSAENRELAIQGLANLASYSFERLVPLFDDRSPKVRAAAVGAMGGSERPFYFDENYYLRHALPQHIYARVVGALDDVDGSVRVMAARVIASLELPGADQELRGAVSRERDPKTLDQLNEALAALVKNGPYSPCQKGTYLELFRFNRLRTAGLDGPDVERAVRASGTTLLANTNIRSSHGYFVAWGTDPEAILEICKIIRTL